MAHRRQSPENHAALKEAGHLVRTERGARIQSDFEGECTDVDFTSAQARKEVWRIAKKNYFDLCIRVFWLDEAEPEYITYAFDNYRYRAGPVLAVGNVYPSEYSRVFYEGQQAEGQKNIVNLVRCVWAGSQKYGALVWSGDIASSWVSLRVSSPLGSIWASPAFLGGQRTSANSTNEKAFRELFVRWLQWGIFCPVMRLHGDREPRQSQQGTTGGATCHSGAENEVWSYGDEVYKICEKYMRLREEMRGHTRILM